MTDNRIGRSYEQIWNERSIRIEKKPVERMKMYRDEDFSKSKVNKRILRGVYECSNLSDSFFSPENVTNIQNQIIKNLNLKLINFLKMVNGIVIKL